MFVVLTILMTLNTLVCSAESFKAVLTENTFVIVEKEDGGNTNPTFKNVTYQHNNVEFPYDKFIDNYFMLDSFIQRTGGSSGLHTGLSVSPELLSNNSQFTFPNSNVRIRHDGVANFQFVVVNDFNTFKQEVDSVKNRYLAGSDRSKLQFNDNFVSFASMDNISIANPRVEQDILTYTESEPIDLGIPVYLNRTLTYKTINKHPKILVDVSLYKPFYGNDYFYVDKTMASILKDNAIKLKNYVYDKFSDIQCVVKEINATSSKESVKSVYGTGVLLKNNIKIIASNKLTYGETVKLFDSSTVRFQGNDVVISDRFKNVYVQSTSNRPEYIQKDIETFVKVEYPFYQINSVKYNGDGSFTFEYGNSKCNINLVTEDVEFEDTGEVFSINTGMFGNASNLKIFRQGETKVASDSLMEAIEYNGKIYHTGRLLSITNTVLSETSGISYDNSELQTIDSTNISYFVNVAEDGTKSIDIKYKNGVGNCIILNNAFLEESGLRNYIKSNTGKTIAQKYNVDVVSIEKLLSGEYSLEEFTLNKDQIVAVQTISKELDRISRDKKLETVRIGLIIFGLVCIVYAILLLIAYFTDRSGGIFGIEILPIITFKNIKVDFETSVSRYGELIINSESRKRVMTIFGVIVTLGIFCLTGIMYNVIITGLINLYNSLLGR